MDLKEHSAVAWWRYPLTMIATYLCYVLFQTLLEMFFKWSVGHDWIVTILIWSFIIMVVMLLVMLQFMLPFLITPTVTGAIIILVISIGARALNITAGYQMGMDWSVKPFRRHLIAEGFSTVYLLYTGLSIIISGVREKRAMRRAAIQQMSEWPE